VRRKPTRRLTVALFTTGTALCSLVLASAGVPVLATDCNTEALEIAAANARLNGVQSKLRTGVLDWIGPDSTASETWTVPTALQQRFKVRTARFAVIYSREHRTVTRS
jgi:ribosomal protein L11 methylase PrmA